RLRTALGTAAVPGAESRAAAGPPRKRVPGTRAVGRAADAVGNALSVVVTVATTDMRCAVFTEVECGASLADHRSHRQYLIVVRAAAGVHEDLQQGARHGPDGHGDIEPGGLSGAEPSHLQSEHDVAHLVRRRRALPLEGGRCGRPAGEPH